MTVKTKRTKYANFLDVGKVGKGVKKLIAAHKRELAKVKKAAYDKGYEDGYDAAQSRYDPDMESM